MNSKSKYYIEAYTIDNKAILGNMDGQGIIEAIDYKRTTIYKNLSHKRTLNNRVAYYLTVDATNGATVNRVNNLTHSSYSISSLAPISPISISRYDNSLIAHTIQIDTHKDLYLVDGVSIHTNISLSISAPDCNHLLCGAGYISNDLDMTFTFKATILNEGGYYIRVYNEDPIECQSPITSGTYPKYYNLLKAVAYLANSVAA